MPACDTCRIRKIRCDRNTPCKSCMSSSFECTTSLRQSRAIRQIGVVSRQKNGNPTVAIRSKTADIPATSRPQDYLNTVSDHTPGPMHKLPTTSSDLSQLPSISLVDSESAEFEGESSLHAHSIAARDLLVKTLGDHPYVRNNPKMISALSSLRQIVEADKIEPSQKKIKLQGLGQPKQAVYEVRLLPTQIVLDIIRKAKERMTYVFSPPLEFVPRDQFNELCKTVFFRTEDYPASAAVIVHGTLRNLIKELKWQEESHVVQQQYDEWIQLCTTNLEIGISSLDLLLPVTMESAQALLIATSYCMEIAQASICKKLATHGCMMVQSLGWHRSSSMTNDSESLRRQKLVMFWQLYIIDKNLSLRLGQASLIQDYDIDLPLPWTDQSAPHKTLKRLNIWANVGRVMGLVYQQLYSPGALKRTDASRWESVQQLLQQVENIQMKTSETHDVSLFIQHSDHALATYMYDFNDLISQSDEITYYALLCMIHRATPTSSTLNSSPAVEYIKYARLALDCHERCASAFKCKPELWAVYLHWTILNTPFVPFTTIFSNVLTTHDKGDLQRLQRFAESMSHCPTSQPAYKISRLATVFVIIATIYVESREQEIHITSVEQRKTSAMAVQDSANPDLFQQTSTYSVPAWTPFNPFLDALGFVDGSTPNMDGSSATNMNLESWFSGNQHIMGLLEDDLSFLDSINLDF